MSTEFILPIVALALILFFFGGAALVMVSLGRARDAATVMIRANLKAFATQTGLTFNSVDEKEQFPTISGRYGGFDVTVRKLVGAAPIRSGRQAAAG